MDELWNKARTAGQLGFLKLSWWTSMKQRLLLLEADRISSNFIQFSRLASGFPFWRSSNEPYSNYFRMVLCDVKSFLSVSILEFQTRLLNHYFNNIFSHILCYMWASAEKKTVKSLALIHPYIGSRLYIYIYVHFGIEKNHSLALDSKFSFHPSKRTVRRHLFPCLPFTFRLGKSLRHLVADSLVVLGGWGCLVRP